MSKDDKEIAGEAVLQDGYPFWVHRDGDTMQCGNAFVRVSSFRWVIEGDYQQLSDYSQEGWGYKGQLETRIKVMHGYIQFLEGLCRDKGIPLPKTYTLSVEKQSGDTLG